MGAQLDPVLLCLCLTAWLGLFLRELLTVKFTVLFTFPKRLLRLLQFLKVLIRHEGSSRALQVGGKMVLSL
jgi:hypothetical protein